MKQVMTKNPWAAAGLGLLIGGAIAGYRIWPSVKEGETTRKEALKEIAKSGIVFGGVAAASTLAGGGKGGGAGLATMSALGIAGQNDLIPTLLSSVLNTQTGGGGGKGSGGGRGMAGGSGKRGGMQGASAGSQAQSKDKALDITPASILSDAISDGISKVVKNVGKTPTKNQAALETDEPSRTEPASASQTDLK